jgi:hypothetical protein
MHRIAYSLSVLLFCAALYGCATIINGSTQDVSVIMPPGTEISSEFGNDITIIHKRDDNLLLRLKRKKDYALLFTNKGREAKIKITSSLDPGWIVADLFTDFIGYIVDGITGAWNSFDNFIIVRFPSDSIVTKEFFPIAEVAQEDPTVENIGLVLNPKIGIVFPMKSTGFTYGIGLGYRAFPKFTFLLDYEAGSGVDILSQYTPYYSAASYTHYNMECRYKMQGNFYIIAGGGLSNITTDSLDLQRYSYDDSTGNIFRNDIRTAPANKWMPTLFAGIGLSGTTTYFEIRQTVGLSKIPLSSGDLGTFGTTSLYFGLNLKF